MFFHIQYTTSSQLESCLLCQIFYFYTEIPDGGSRETDKFLDIVLLDGGLLRRYEFTPKRRAHSQFGVLGQYIFQYLHNISASFSCLVFFFFFFFLIIPDTIWARIDNIQNEEVRELACSLPEVILAARAESTTTKYQRGWKSWLQWSSEKDITSIPADPFHVAIFLNYVLKTANNKGALTIIFYGIRWGHYVNGFETPTDHPFVTLAFEGKIMLEKTKNVQRPINTRNIEGTYHKI